MSDRQEFYAATVEEAVDKASKALNVAPDRIRFEVLDQGSSGFLGIGTRDARTVEEDGPAEGEVPDDLIIAVDEFAISLVEAMGIDATVDVYDSGDVIAVDITTQETGLLIGQKGETIDAIQGMAHRTARRALREQRPLSLPPMSPAERRIVHLFLKENTQVTTSSQGEEENRRVVVSPV